MAQAPSLDTGYCSTTDQLASRPELHTRASELVGPRDQRLAAAHEPRAVKLLMTSHNLPGEGNVTALRCGQMRASRENSHTFLRFNIARLNFGCRVVLLVAKKSYALWYQCVVISCVMCALEYELNWSELQAVALWPLRYGNPM